jgi:glyoxylase-like metal-dependent hydrolase (beta-lactamase superfamily II)
MVHQVIFYPVGCGDTSQIVLANNRRVLMDFHHIADTEVNNRPEINLAEQLRNELRVADRDDYDVVAFTHGDEDHIMGSTDFFEL